MRRNLIFLGAPGAGKGTFASMLTDKISITHISTGEIFRNEIKNETELGKTAKKFVESGGLVPDDIVAKMVSKRLAEPDCSKGFILDGFPRTINQAELLTDALNVINKSIDAVIYFEAGDELLIQRLTARLTCRKCSENFNKIFGPPKAEGICDKCGGELYQRADDSLETATNRLSLYKEQTAPLVAYYKKEGLLLTINSERDKNTVLPELIKMVD
jgi:adenylate kinase